MTDTDWQSRLDSSPDRMARLVYADWLEEQGRNDEAYLQRWLANRFHRSPSRPRLPCCIIRALAKQGSLDCRSRQETEAALLCVLPAIQRHEMRLYRARQRRAEKKW